MTDPRGSSPVVGTRLGMVAGTSCDVPGVTVFRGIPFAADTGGQNRWRPPHPAEPWEGVRQATGFGPICPQNQRGSDHPMSEDCLTVNVWSPDGEKADPKPVLVWIYGGRFIFGSGRDSQSDGAALAARGLVVVVFNYRVGALGFLATPELSAESGTGASGNYGLLDQIAALRWVQQNIAAFGGDPGRVTIAGQSAGAASMMSLVYSPMTQGMVHGAIALSGASHPADPGLAYLAAAYRLMPDAEREGLEYQRAHGVSDVAALRRLPAAELLMGNDADEAGPGDHRPPLFRPVLDGRVFARTYAESLATGAHRDVPVITGTTKDEDGASPQPDVTLTSYRARARREYGELADDFLTLYPAGTDEEAAAMSNASARDRSRVSTYLWSRLWAARAQSPTYTYFWTHAAPGPDAHLRGAFHSSEISYLFDSLRTIERPWTDQDWSIAGIMAGYVTNFVATGDPNGPGLARWSPTAADNPVTMEVGDAFSPIPVAEPNRFRFHESFLEGRERRR